MAADAVVIDHPNRRRAASRITQVLVVLLLLVSAALIAVVTIGGWDELQGAKALQIAYIVLDVLMAFLVARWNRGVLPVAAALAIVMLIFALIAGPQWFDRDKEGFAQTGARRERPRPRDAPARAGPGAPRPRRDVGLPPGVERRGRAAAGAAAAGGASAGLRHAAAYDVTRSARVAELVRRAALKTPWPSGHVGSSPTPGTPPRAGR